MRYASIDIGTNTVLLLIAEVDNQNRSFKTVHEEIAFPRIGNELKQSGKISDEKVEELLSLLDAYKKKVAQHNCWSVYAVGTHALRTAKNGSDIAQRIVNDLNIPVEIISPMEEADYAFSGVKSQLSTEGKTAIIDIGGGSTEIIIADTNEVIKKTSFPVGVVTLKSEFISQYPIVEEEKNALQNKIQSVFSNESIWEHDIQRVIGISGTPTTLAAITRNLTTFDVNKIDSMMLSENSISNITNWLGNATLEQIKTRYRKVIEKREDILYIGGIILINIMNYLRFSNVYVSTRGIRHGVIYKKFIADK